MTHITLPLPMQTVVFFTSAITVLTACSTDNQEPEQDTLQPNSAVIEQHLQTRKLVDTYHQISEALPQPTTSMLLQAEPVGLRNNLPAISSDNEKYQTLDDNRTIMTIDQPVSTFSIDVDTGSYANVRRFLNNGQLPPVDAVRVEELLNYFNYDYATSTDSEHPFSIVTELGPSPWNENTRLMHVGLQAGIPADINEQAANLTFLIDVSGSMNSHNKLGLLKSAMSLMVQELDINDTVSIVVYAGSSGVALEPTPGNERRKIERAFAQLRAGGSTHGSQGIELAYQLALDNYVDNGTNRVILATDGDFNVGISDTKTLVELIKEKRKAGIALTTLGFGMGNYNDHLLEQLADAGDGNYAYIDTLGEARKVLVDELTATLVTIAKDVKVQVEFNPGTVSEYRLIGYTNRILANEDFNDDKIDAGDIGAGHSVTALYEVALHNEGGERHTPRRYGHQKKPEHSALDNEVAEVRLRYKQPGNETSRLIKQVVELESGATSVLSTSNAFRFSAGVAAFGQLLRGDSRMGEFRYADTRELAQTALGTDPYGYRAEFVRLVDLAQSLDSLQQAARIP